MSDGSGRIAALDGVRAVCILLVLCAHVPGTGVVPMHPFVHLCADLGVRGFFVLSGFLITGILLREQSSGTTGEVLRNFYIRRAIRIFPASYALLGCALVLAAVGVVVLRPGDAICAATYTMNFHSDRAWPLGHLWSLAVEEQFYLLWPAVLLFVTRHRASRVLAASLAVAPIARLSVWYLLPAHRAIADQAFPCVFDALATGCLLAFHKDALDQSATYRRVRDSRAFAVILAVACGTLAINRPWFQLGIAPTLANLAIATAIHRCVAMPASRSARVLARPLMVRVGVWSYSLYLWQQLFINRHSTVWFHRFPVNIVLAFAAAIASYYLVERPFLRLTHLFRRSEPRPALAPAATG